MKKEQKKERKKERKSNQVQTLPLTMLLTGIVFLNFIFTAGIIAVIIVLFFRNSSMSFEFITDGRYSFFITLVIFLSFVIGVLMSFLISKLVLRPVTKIINAFKSLASGDFETRVTVKGYLGRMPGVVELQKSFNDMAEELQNTEMLRSDFINNFSHEFKTPIVSIVGFAGLLKHGNLDEGQKAEYIDIIEKEAKRLSTMAKNILCLTKVENQTILTNVAKFNLSEQIRSCLLLLEDKWMEKELELDVDFDEYYIEANSELLREVWINLLHNAVKFAPSGSELGVKIYREENSVSVVVSNACTEMPDKEKIFKKFYQGDESHASEGNGIGLAIVKQIVKLHHGKIDVDFNGERIFFTVELPVKSK